MNIIEAVKSVTPEKPYIYRRLWCFPDKEPHDGTILVEPLNAIGSSKVSVLAKGKGVTGFASWNCSAEDLTADDWEIYADTEKNVLVNALGDIFKTPSMPVFPAPIGGGKV